MAGFGNLVRVPFDFLFQRPQKEELVAEYVIREHHRGRALDDIVKDAYVTNRLTDEQFGRVLERPEVLHALGADFQA